MINYQNGKLNTSAQDVLAFYISNSSPHPQFLSLHPSILSKIYNLCWSNKMQHQGQKNNQFLFMALKKIYKNKKYTLTTQKVNIHKKKDGFHPPFAIMLYSQKQENHLKVLFSIKG